MPQFEVLIVGAGPAGAAAAQVLAEAGAFRVAVVDKARLPRPKACGGIFPYRLLAKIGDSSAFPSDAEYRALRFSNRGNAVVSQSAHLLGVDRGTFDHQLAQRAVKRGAGAITLIEQFDVAMLSIEDDYVRISERTGNVLSGRVLIAADGAFSRIARLAGLNRGHVVRPAIDLEIEANPEDVAALGQMPAIDLFELDDGYGWIFPKADRLSCGVVSWSGKTNLNDALGRYLARRLPGGWRVLQRMGHGIPIYTSHTDIARGRIMLAGDAANLAEPIYGAGIEAAYESGMLAGRAARAICAGEDTPEAISRAYQQQVHSRIGGPTAAVARHVSPLFRERPEFFYRNFVAGKLGHEAFAARMDGLTFDPSSERQAMGLFA
ncbi:geranylgeranyl reductase family protein [Sphingomonas sp.]|uniref:geranylgeranyl reductase family protein n=1 Tax=Sphingomonas sp. TaxID=28214 RepID=UPI00180AF6ED|nr:geranylgeranyl reductase family protein [Sphingomonas sp.]MBA4763536.1 geranylgeranyl reductase family protein [Sphingomonas sp.]